MHILEEWRLRDIEQKADRATSRLWELDTLKNDVANLEHTLRETRSILDELRNEIQRQEIRINELPTTTECGPQYVKHLCCGVVPNISN